MSIRNRKFSRTNYSTDAAMENHRHSNAQVDPNPFGEPTEGGDIDNPAHQQAEGQQCVKDMNDLQNHRGGYGNMFAKEAK